VPAAEQTPPFTSPGAVRHLVVIGPGAMK
jgi:hypothetical protein